MSQAPPAFGGTPAAAGGLASTAGSSSTANGFGAAAGGVGSTDGSSSPSRGNTLFPLAALFHHKLTNVAYHRQKLRKLRLDEISSLFHEKDVGSYFLKIFDVPGKSETDRRVVESGEVPGVSDDLRRHTELRMDILAFSDQYDLNELICLDYVVAIFRNPSLVRDLESGDATKYAGYYDLNDRRKVIEAAMDLYLYERQAVLKSLLLLLKVAYMSESCAVNTDRNPDTVTSALESESGRGSRSSGSSREKDIIEDLVSHLIKQSNLRERMVGQAAQMFVKIKNRHDDNDSGFFDEDGYAGGGGQDSTAAGKGFAGKGLSNLLGANASSQLSRNSSGSSSSSINTTNTATSANNYSSPKAVILRHFEELHALGEILFYCYSVNVPTLEDVNRLQILASVISGYVTRDDLQGEGYDAMQNTLLQAHNDNLSDFHQLYQVTLHSFLISLQLTHVASLKIMASLERDYSLDSLLGLIPSEYRRDMTEMRIPNSLKWGEGMLLFSYLHVLAARAMNDNDNDGTDLPGSYYHEGRSGFTDYNYQMSPGLMQRAQSIDSGTFLPLFNPFPGLI